jgi:hypothetical protein
MNAMRDRLDKPVLEPLMISFVMVVIDEFLEGPSEMRSPSGTIRSRHSYLIDRTNRSAWAFALGA